MIRIQLSTIDDLNEIIRLEKEWSDAGFVEQNSREEHLEQMQLLDVHHLTIHSTDDIFIGYIILLEHLKESSLELKRIVVSQQGKGFGRLALQYVIELFRNKTQFNKLILDVYKWNARARQLYLSEGFEIVREDKELYFLEFNRGIH